jgi:hypothetical protein
MAICDEISVKPFWDFSDTVVTARINGSISHHCDICPKSRDESCNLSCHSTRQDIKDGVTIT